MSHTRRRWSRRLPSLPLALSEIPTEQECVPARRASRSTARLDSRGPACVGPDQLPTEAAFEARCAAGGGGCRRGPARQGQETKPQRP